MKQKSFLIFAFAYLIFFNCSVIKVDLLANQTAIIFSKRNSGKVVFKFLQSTRFFSLQIPSETKFALKSISNTQIKNVEFDIFDFQDATISNENIDFHFRRNTSKLCGNTSTIAKKESKFYFIENKVVGSTL